MAISKVFELGKRALLNHQTAISVTSENIANANTEGYTRRRINSSGVNLDLTYEFQVASGLREDDVSLVRQHLIDQQIWRESHALGNFGTKARILSQIEPVFSNSGDSGFANILSEFWNSWNDLANDPESQSARVTVRDNGNMLKSSMQQLYNNLRSQQENLSSEIKTQVDAVNQIAAQISKINKKVLMTGSLDLVDQRNTLIQEMSQKVDLTVQEETDGTATVSVNGLVMVSSTYLNSLTVETSSENRNVTSSIKFADSNKDAGIISGELGGLLKMQNEVIPDYADRLDKMARSIAREVNAVHEKGFNTEDITGISFFSQDVFGVEDFSVNSVIQQDPSLIAARPAGAGTGNGEIAQSVNDLQLQELIDGENVLEFYNSMTTDLGNQVQDSVIQANTQDIIVQQFQNQREAISGVSLDEEMAQLIQYEQAYQAAVKVVKTADEMFQTLLQLT